MSELISLELKYCERCGGLLLRRSGLNLNFCRPCQRIERDLPPLRPLRPRSPLPGKGAVVPFRSARVETTGALPEVHACWEGEQA